MSIVILILWASFGAYGYWIALIKRRSIAEGVSLGLLLGPIGVVVAATFRDRTEEEAEEEVLRRRDEAQARFEADQRFRAIVEAEADRRRQEAQLLAEESRVRRAEILSRFRDWFDRTIVRFGWFKALPEFAQPIVIGLLVALPLALMTVLLFKGR